MTYIYIYLIGLSPPLLSCSS